MYNVTHDFCVFFTLYFYSCANFLQVNDLHALDLPLRRKNSHCVKKDNNIILIIFYSSYLKLSAKI